MRIDVSPRLLRNSAAVVFTMVVLYFFIPRAPAQQSMKAGSEQPAAGQPRPALTVSAIRMQEKVLPERLTANGTIAAWREAVVSAEVGGLRLRSIEVEVGDRVERGQVLATFASEALEAELAQAQAALAEAQALLTEARANARRTRMTDSLGTLSAQQISHYQTGEKTAEARVQSAQARVHMHKLRLGHARITAPDAGIVIGHAAAIGAVVQPGQELFRLIRQDRLEWRAEVTAAELERLQPGIAVMVFPAGARPAQGTVRAISPAVDPQHRTALVYVDLPDAYAQGLKPGMFARGEFALTESPGLTLPQDAIVMQDGLAYAYRINAGQGPLARVQRIRLKLGRQAPDAVEIIDGLRHGDQVVASGASLLRDGDTVRLLQP